MFSQPTVALSRPPTASPPQQVHFKKPQPVPTTLRSQSTVPARPLFRPVQRTPQKTALSHERLDRLISELLEPLRRSGCTIPVYKLHPRSGFTIAPVVTTLQTRHPRKVAHYSQAPIYGEEDRAFTDYSCTRQPDLILAFLIADANVMFLDPSTRGHHFRQYAQYKFGLNGGEIAAFLRVSSLGVAVVSVQGHLVRFPITQITTTPNVEGPEGRPRAFPHFIMASLCPLFYRSDPKKRATFVCSIRPFPAPLAIYRLRRTSLISEYLPPKSGSPRCHRPSNMTRPPRPGH